MANCNDLFGDFNRVITPSAEEMDKMRASRERLEKKISDTIQEKLGMTVSFYTQGSGAKHMKTIIIKANGTYDADRGVYLPQKPDVTAKTVQEYVLDAVSDYTDGGAQHRRKCIRVLFKCAYNIDFPVYYEAPNEDCVYIAVKDDGWIKDDPAKMIEWTSSRKDPDGQLFRIIKFTKAWASERSFKMPSGIALAVWVARNFSAVTDRDDQSLLQTLEAVQAAISGGISCPSPVEPYDDLVAKLSDDQKDNFRKALENLCSDARKAVDSNNQLKASKIWQKHLGARFPDGVDEDVDKKAALLMASAKTVLDQRAMLDRTGKINENSGITHLGHRSYGGQ
jgi:hypothetical protein